MIVLPAGQPELKGPAIHDHVDQHIFTPSTLVLLQQRRWLTTSKIEINVWSCDW